MLPSDLSQGLRHRLRPSCLDLFLACCSPQRRHWRYTAGEDLVSFGLDDVGRPVLSDTATLTCNLHMPSGLTARQIGRYVPTSCKPLALNHV